MSLRLLRLFLIKPKWLPESGCVLDHFFSYIDFLTSWVTLPIFSTGQTFFLDGQQKLSPCYTAQLGYLGKSVDKMEGPPYLKPGLYSTHRTPLPVPSAFAAADGVATRTKDEI